MPHQLLGTRDLSLQSLVDLSRPDARTHFLLIFISFDGAPELIGLDSSSCISSAFHLNISRICKGSETRRNVPSRHTGRSAYELVEVIRRRRREHINNLGNLIVLLRAMARIPQCPFCDIVNGQAEERTTAILYRDDHVVAFEDRNPSAFRHYLVIPVAHVKNVGTLKKSSEDYDMVTNMWKTGQLLLQRDAPNSQHRFGFHKPPWYSVDHLHLHCLALPYKSWRRATKYTSFGCLGAYVSVEKVSKRLDPNDGRGNNLPDHLV
ncbi:hypothetical protein R1flu_011277 [Riccia fluitans]|uniref:HIT domain-containing protein n=1 Tax=Riccia fluitans TaxID=41844 RepID=A0ABD1Z7I8_9MARC